jgi:hypothetical protein
MKKPNKYLYGYKVQGYYASHYGWEDVTWEDTCRQAREQLKCYRGNCPEYPHRIVKGREENPDFLAYCDSFRG